MNSTNYSRPSWPINVCRPFKAPRPSHTCCATLYLSIPHLLYQRRQSHTRRDSPPVPAVTHQQTGTNATPPRLSSSHTPIFLSCPTVRNYGHFFFFCIRVPCLAFGLFPTTWKNLRPSFMPPVPRLAVLGRRRASWLSLPYLALFSLDGTRVTQRRLASRAAHVPLASRREGGITSFGITSTLRPIPPIHRSRLRLHHPQPHRRYRRRRRRRKDRRKRGGEARRPARCRTA